MSLFLAPREMRHEKASVKWGENFVSGHKAEYSSYSYVPSASEARASRQSTPDVYEEEVFGRGDPQHEGQAPVP